MSGGNGGAKGGEGAVESSEVARYVTAGDLTLDLEDERAFLEGRPMQLSPKPYALLCALMARPQILVTKEALFETVWEGLAIGDAVLTTAVKEVRQALGDAARAPDWIETVHGKGYRFLKPVATSATPPASLAVRNVGASAGDTGPQAASSDSESATELDLADAPRPYRRPTALRVASLVGILAAAALAVFWILSPDAPRRQAAETSAAQRAAAAPTERPKSIAVLPFADMSPDGDQTYFSDGVALEILNALARAPGLQVAARTSSFAFKGQNTDVREVGRQLDVGAVLEGSVRKQGEAVRVTAQLIQTSDGYDLWSASYDGSLDDIFEFQERIARSVADELAVILDTDAATRLAKRLTDSREAYDLFLRARALVAPRFGEDTLATAISLLEEAIEIDPTFAEAWAELARASYFLPQYMPVADAEPYLSRSIEATDKALALDPSLARAYLARAGVHSHRGEFVKTYEALSRAIELDSEDADIVGAVGYYWSYLGLPERAIPYLERAVALDPINVTNLFTLGVAKMNAGDLDAAEGLLARAAELGHTPAIMIRPQIAALQGRGEVAARQFAAAFEMTNPAFRAEFSQVAGPDADAAQLVGQALYGGDEAARAIVREGLRRCAEDPGIALNPAAFGVMLQAGEYDLFMRTFEGRRFGGATFVLSILWDARERTSGLRRHKDFPAFAERIGLADAWRAHGAPEGCREVEGSFICA
ncbi:MAG: winged helix-turn-helix domain-containing protein [Pseudomonadota bacterium]